MRKELPATRAQEHLALLDTLPLFLDQMTDALSDQSVQKRIDREVSQVAELHGEARAEVPSYTLAQVLLEYRILREVVFSILESEDLLPPEKRDIIFNSFQTAMTGAASEFMRVKVFRLQAAQGQAELYAKSLQDLESVTEVALSQGASYQVMLHELLGRIRAIFNCDTVLIYALSEDDKELVPCAAHGLDEELKPGERLPVDRAIMESILSNEGKPFFVEDLSQVENISSELRSKNVRSLLGITLKNDEKVIGVILLGSLLTRQFSERDQGLFALIAERMAAAMDNASQFEKSKNELEKTRAESALRGRYVSLLSHDIRNPITAAKMNSELLVRQKGKPEVVQQLSQKITENLMRADQLIKDLLDVNRILSGISLSLEVTPFEMSAMVVEAVASLTGGEAERFIFHPKGPVECFGSSPELIRAIEILLKCSVHFSKSGSPILISLESEPSNLDLALSVQLEGRTLSTEEVLSLSAPAKSPPPGVNPTQRDFTMELTLMGGIIRAHGGSVEVGGPRERSDRTSITIHLPKDARPFIQQAA